MSSVSDADGRVLGECCDDHVVSHADDEVTQSLGIGVSDLSER